MWRDTGLGDALISSLPAVREGAPVGLNPALRIYRYAMHEVFGSHYDDYAVTDAGVTAFTFLLYLTGDEKENPVVGGETAFFGSCSDGARALFEVKPERGAALIFRHGPECMPHASLPVRGGSRPCCARTSCVGKDSCPARENDRRPETLEGFARATSYRYPIVSFHEWSVS